MTVYQETEIVSFYIRSVTHRNCISCVASMPQVTLLLWLAEPVPRYAVFYVQNRI